jgi:oligosaccharide reducing-end xylanase
VTGLMPDYANFDGTPHIRRGHEDFRYDAWRTLSNVALDHAWFAADPWSVEQSNRVLRFLATQGPACPNQFKLDGTPLSTGGSTGLTAMAATAGLAADAIVARPFVERLWELKIPDGQYRYYDGLLYLLALLEVSGRFQIHSPAAGASAPVAIPPSSISGTVEDRSASAGNLQEETTNGHKFRRKMEKACSSCHLAGGSRSMAA